MRFNKIGNQLSIRKSEFEKQSSAIVEYEGLPANLFVYRHSNDEYTASLMRCTHKGCQVEPANIILVCPCHGSEYSTTGKVLKGPATDDLTQYPVKTDRERIYIEVSTPTTSGLDIENE